MQGPAYLTIERRGSGPCVPAQPTGIKQEQCLALHDHAHHAANGVLDHHMTAATWHGPPVAPGAVLDLSLVVASPRYTLDPAYPCDPPGGTSPVTNLSGVSLAQTGSHQQTGSHFSLPGFGPEHDDARNFLGVRAPVPPPLPPSP